MLCGFTRGLNPDYEAFVEPKQPKDFGKAVKYAQIYDDILRRGKSGTSKSIKGLEQRNSKRKKIWGDKGSGGQSEP